MSPRLPAKEKQTLVASLATMLSAGIPILEAVDTLREESKGPTLKVLEVWRSSLADGRPLSHAMRKLPQSFDPVTVNIIQAAEEAGTLEEALHNLAESIKRDMAFNDQVRSSLLYPAFIMVIFAAVLTVILVFVVPRVSQVFVGLRVELPVPTQVLIAVSNFMLAYYLYLLAGIGLLVGALVVLVRTQKRRIIAAALSLPLLGRLGRMIDLARFSRSMNQLLRAGVPVAEALELSAKVVNKREIADVISHMQASVNAGKPLVDGLDAHSKAIPPIMRRILETAERSGTLESTMADMAEYSETQVARMLKTVTTMIEPVMIVLIAVLVGGMMLAIIAPIYNIISQINQR